jgi:hypothetical protein
MTVKWQPPPGMPDATLDTPVWRYLEEVGVPSDYVSDELWAKRIGSMNRDDVRELVQALHLAWWDSESG